MADIGTYALDAFEDEAVQDILEQNEWMKECTFRLLTKRQEVTEYIDDAIQKGICAVDLETDSLNTRAPLSNLPTAKIVGVCLATSIYEGIYIPVSHDDTEYNVPYEFMVRELKRLAMNCNCVYHNFKYDGGVMYNHGIYNTDETMYEDTLIMSSIEDASRKNKGLKYLSEALIKRPMVEIDGLGITGNTRKVVAFNMVHPRKAVYYGGSDAMNTLALYYYFKERIDAQDPQRRAGPWAIYKVEKRCLYVTMEMERNLILIDIPYLKDIQEKLIVKSENILQGIYDIVGRKFDVNSPKQLGTILFDELKIPYPSKEKTASGQYQTSQAILEKIDTDNPVAKMLLTYRQMQKVVGTYVNNLIANADENNCCKFQMNQNRADTGRFTASGGKGLYEDGYSGVNCQNIPTYNKKDPNSVDIRKSFIAHPGKQIVTIDYSGEELRIATNLSREPNWLEEFINGEGDLHSITARAIYQKDVVAKEERGVGKTLNFLTVYGGGAGGFAQLAKIPYETAKRMQINFFKENKGLQKWIKDEAARAKKRGYSKTALGRRRPLKEFYSSPDKGIQAKGDRCAINSAVQGTGADIIKIALYRVWKWIHSDPEREKHIRILMPVHDEIVYEITETKMEDYIPELSRIMKLEDIVDKLGWDVKFEVDAEYGNSFSITHDFKDYYENGEYERIQKLKQKEEGIEVEESEEEESEVVEEGPTQVEEPVQEVKEETVITGDNNTKDEDGSVENFDYSTTIKSEVDKNKIVDIDLSSIEAEPGEGATDEAAVKNPALKDRVDARGYFNYTLENSMSESTSVKMGVVFRMLKIYDEKMFMGPCCRIKLIDKSGEVLLKTKKRFNVDAFVALCLWNEI
jgi:DNA polymerase-1